MLLATFTCGAVNVNTTSGNLASEVTDKTVTSLAISGEIDARDLVFVANDLTELTELDLSGASIVAYESDEPVLGNAMRFAADELPATVFFGKNYTSVVLPTTLKVIGNQAMAGCARLTAVEIPASVTRIGDDAFNGSGITSVTIPASVLTMGDRAFAYCESLTSATVLCEDLGPEAFASCSSLSQATIGNGVKTIGSGAFKGATALQEISVTEGSSLEAIGDCAFMGSGIKSADLSNLSNLTAIGMWAFANCENLNDLNLSGSVKSVGDGAFFYNTGLESVQMPQGITRVGDYLFAGCNAVNNDSVIIEGYKEVGRYAFYNWDQVTRFVVSGSVTSIGDRAMAGMTALEMMSSYAVDVPELGENVWDGVEQQYVTLFVNEASVDAYRDAAQWQEFKIDMEPTEVSDITGDLADISAHFSGHVLVVKSNEPLSLVTVYDVNGVLLSKAEPSGSQVEINIGNFGGKIYVVSALTASGNKRTFKLIRR